MTAGEARLADTIGRILGMEGLTQLIVQLKSEGADFNNEQRLNLLRALMPHLSEEELEEELKALLVRDAAKQK